MPKKFLTIKLIKMSKVSCVICAYNEEERIANVLSVVVKHKDIDEIIVVDDGSKDKTVEVVKKFPTARLISLPVNKGKSFALAIGVSFAEGKIIMLLDADLVGLSENNISQLIEPVIYGQADMSISLRENSLLIYKMIGLDFVSGERVFYKDFLSKSLEEIKTLKSYEVEVFMNKIIIKKKLRLKIVKWNNVISLRKSAKVGLWKGILGEITMILQILKSVSLFEIVRQNYKMLRLSK